MASDRDFVPRSLRLSAAQDDFLRNEAARLRTNCSEVIRRTIDAARGAWPPPLPGALDMARSEPSSF